MTRLEDAVEGALELLGITDTRVHGKTGTGKVQRVHDQERCGSGKTTRGDVAEEAGPEASRAGDTEPLLVVFLQTEIHGLQRDIMVDIRKVVFPEGPDTLLLGHTHDDVGHASVWLENGGPTRVVRRLAVVSEYEMDALNRCRSGLGDGSCHTSK